jgi:radical SAM superfamily enzyme YgiQ (UPF0313 family)
MFMDRYFAPPMETLPDSAEAFMAPYALRKVEAALVSQGISDVAVVPPEHLVEAVGPRTKVIGVTAHDPFGFSPVSTKLTMLFGGGPCWNEQYFAELGQQIRTLRSQQPLWVIVGGPGVWQMSYRRPDWVDTVFLGDAEVDLPPLMRSALAGSFVPPEVHAKAPPLDQIPLIRKPARNGEVQVTRGCPRGCEFCSITPEKYRTIPLEDILHEVAINQAAGEWNVDIVTDDILLYGSKKLRTNHDAVVELFTTLKRAGAQRIGFAHVSAPAVRESPQTMLDSGHVAEWDVYRGLTPVVGLETGSVRVFRKYMRAKAFPYQPEEWKDVILESTVTLNQAGVDPCYTMTIGFPDETDADVEQSMDLVQALIDQGSRCYVFPLPVIPISTSRIRGNAMPQLESLPERYWDLLAMCWKHDLEITRAMLPTFNGKMRNPVTRRMTQVLTDRIAPQVIRIFEQFRETHGRSAYRYKDVTLDGVTGTMRSMYWLFRSTVVGPVPASPTDSTQQSEPVAGTA